MTTDEALRLSDEELAKATANAIGWPVYPHSAHEEGSRPYPHCYPHHRRRALIVFDGSESRMWNPLAPADCADVERWLLARTELGQIESKTGSRTVEVIVRRAWGSHYYAGTLGNADPIAARCRCICAIAVVVAAAAPPREDAARRGTEGM